MGDATIGPAVQALDWRPRFSSIHSDGAMTEPDDLTAVKGIGPVYAERLVAADMTTFAALVSAGAEAVGDAAGVSTDTATKWVKSAAAQG